METFESGRSVASVARDHGLNANMVFSWRRDSRFGPGRDTSGFFPVEVPGVLTSSASTALNEHRSGQVEIMLTTGHYLKLSGSFDVDTVLRLAKGLAVP